MKRFSQSLPEDREFEVAGVVFRWRYPYWEEIVGVFDTDISAEGEDGKDLTFKENVEIFIDRIGLFIEDGQKDDWFALAGRRENPIPYAQFSEIYTWLLGVASGRPTEPPSPSESGDQTTAST